MTLIERLRETAKEIAAWDPNINADYCEWSDLMDEAADALSAAQDEPA